jgi:stage II sporulation protein D
LASIHDNRITFDNWQPDSRVEPLVRIGVMLAEDKCNAIRLRTSSDTCRLIADDRAPVELPPNTRLTMTLAHDRVHVVSDGLTDITGAVVRVSEREPIEYVPIRTQSGILVHDVIAGRGFHWQKRIDQRLPGAIEVRAETHGLILINELLLEQYLAGVITAEMSGACPVPFLAAQCVVARSWILARSEPKHLDEPFDRCNDDCCQRYQGTDEISPSALVAVRQSFGELLMDPQNAVVDANYSKSCGGIAETPQSVWGCDKPGLEALVDAPADDPLQRFLPVTPDNLDDFLDGDWLEQTRGYCSPHVVPSDSIERYLGRVDIVDEYFRWTECFSRQDVEQWFRERDPQFVDLAEITDLLIGTRGSSGRAEELIVNWNDNRGGTHSTTIVREYNIRALLHPHFLYSSAIRINLQRDDANAIQQIELRGAGWGHGAGMCQIGALGMALSGHDYRTICQHYYPTARLQRVYERAGRT